MLLAIDSGNTNVVFGVFDGDEFLKAFRCANDPKRTADEYIVWLKELMALNDLDVADVTGCIIGSVVPETAFNLISLCRRYFPGEPMVIGDPGLKLGNEALIERPDPARAVLEMRCGKGTYVRSVARDLADHAIDTVSPDPATTVEKLLAYADTDEAADDAEVLRLCLELLPARSPKRAGLVARLDRLAP